MGACDLAGSTSDFASLDEGTRGYFGLTAAPGFSLYGKGGLQGSVLFALRGGVLFDRTELGLEFSPVTWVSGLADGRPHLQLQATIGGYPRLGEQSYWPLRFGTGFVTVNTGGKVLLQLRADLIGFAYQLGPVLLELSLPTYRFAVEPDDGLFILSWQFGLSGSFIGRGRPATAQFPGTQDSEYRR